MSGPLPRPDGQPPAPVLLPAERPGYYDQTGHFHFHDASIPPLGESDYLDPQFGPDGVYLGCLLVRR